MDNTQRILEINLLDRDGKFIQGTRLTCNQSMLDCGTAMFMARYLEPALCQLAFVNEPQSSDPNAAPAAEAGA